MAGFTVPIAGPIAAGVLLFKLIFSLASTTLVTFSAAILCCLREFNISRASCTFPLILNRASFWTSFSRASLTPSLCRASVSPIFCRASNVRWKLTAGDDLFRRFCWIPMRDLTPPNTGLVLSLGGGGKKKKSFRHYKTWYSVSKNICVFANTTTQKSTPVGYLNTTVELLSCFMLDFTFYINS